MEVLYERCCGLDIHKRAVVACLVVPGPTGKPVKGLRSFGTMTDDPLRLADLLRHGLLKAGFVPNRPQRELRELTRDRTSPLQARTAEVNRLRKVLEGANIKLASVAADVMGLSGRQMPAALVGGETDAAALAQPAKGRPRGKIPQPERALAGGVGAPQRFLLARQWRASTSWMRASRR